MSTPLSFICPMKRADLQELGALKHCPQCNLDIPDMSALTLEEEERVRSAIQCAREQSDDLHFCSSYQVDEQGEAVFLSHENPPGPLANLVDTTPKLLLAIAAVSALGLTAQLHVFQHILAPAWEGHPVFVLDEEGPRFEPERADAFTAAIDASEDAWLTLNLAAWRRALSPPPPKTHDEGMEIGGW